MNKFPREYRGNVARTIEVDGFAEPLDITPTGADHVSVSTKSGQWIHYRYRGEDLPLHLNVHVAHNAENGWHVMRNPYVSRGLGRDASPTLTKQVSAAILTAVLGWVSDNEDLLKGAQDTKLNNAARTVEETIGRLESLLAVMRDKLATIEGGEYVSPYVPEEHRNIF
jgi:hypothetical protein